MVDACNCRKTFGLGIGQPTMPVPSRAITNENGFATIVFNAVDPKITGAILMGRFIRLYTRSKVRTKSAGTCVQLTSIRY